jgi:hypothetical protein
MLNMLSVETTPDRQTGGMLWAGDKDEVGKDPVASEFEDDRAIDDEPDEEDRESSEDEDEKPVD